MIKKDNIYTSVEMTKSERYLHTPGSFAKQNLLYVQEVGNLESLTPHRSARENLDSFLMLIVLDGKGALEIGGREIPVQKGDCAWIDCMKHYEHISDEKDAWKLAWVHFNGRSARAYYDLFQKLNDAKSVFHVDDIDEWDKVIQDIMACQREKQILSEMECGELLMHLINLAMKVVAQDDGYENSQGRMIAAEVRDFVNEQFVDKQVMELLADEFHKPSEVLGETFKAAYGISLESYISNRRYNAAKELLRFSVKSMSDVAAESGIGDVILMQQLFQENEGVSAEDYRKKWAGWIRG